jgi:hypothetical protein
MKDLLFLRPPFSDCAGSEVRIPTRGMNEILRITAKVSLTTVNFEARQCPKEDGQL